MLRKSDFYYDLPEELIAQTPLQKRDQSRMMKIDRSSGFWEHSHFYNLCDYLKKGDLLVMNDSKVFPARIYGKKRNSDVTVEFLLLSQRTMNEWEVLVRPGRRLKVGAVVDFSDELSAEIIEIIDDGNRIVKFTFNGIFYDILGKIGKMPLPPYIHEQLNDGSRYNTIYSKETGSAAAPTAGLHFTDEVLENIKSAGIDTAYITLHVGLGTFRPVKEENILDHKMHSEHFTMNEETAKKIIECKKNGGRVIGVGTTSCRTLEAIAQTGGIRPCSDSTSIFIYPGYDFKIIDGMLTNFHLPESTLIMLVSAFIGRENTLSAYAEAIKEKYRFFSFGDCMLII